MIQNLTSQEIEGAYLARYDLGPGYPQLDPADYVRRLYLDDHIEELSLKYPPEWSTPKQRKVSLELSHAVREFVGIRPASALEIRTTFSGTVALDRAVSAARRCAAADGMRGIRVVTTSPSIDVLRSIIEEHQVGSVTYVEAGNDLTLSAQRLRQAIQLDAMATEDLCVVVILSSPENPTGQFWSKPDLAMIAKDTMDAEGILLVDHCFSLAGVQAHQVPMIWDTAESVGNLRWLAVWDTGKTFGLNEDKLGFVIAPLPMTRFVDAALGVFQFDVSRRQKLFFSALLHQGFYFDHVAHLRKKCEINLDRLQAGLIDTPFKVLVPPAGSLALLELPKGGPADVVYRSKLLARGIGVVSGHVFFHGKKVRRDLLRVALARETSQFDEAIEFLVPSLLEILEGAPTERFPT